MQSPRLKIHAFTLIELLIVMTVIAMMSGAVVVSLQGRDQTHALRASADDLASAIRYASQHASTGQQRCRLVIDQASGTYRAEEYLPGSMAIWQELTGMPGHTHELLNKVSLLGVRTGSEPIAQSDQYVIEFHGRNSGFHGAIVLQNQLLDTVEVRVMPVTRQVLVITSTESGVPDAQTN